MPMPDRPPGDLPTATAQEEAAILSSMLDRFIAMIASRDRRLIEEVWSESGFTLVGSERGEVCQTREAVEAKLETLYGKPHALVLDFPTRQITTLKEAGWIFADGSLTLLAPDGSRAQRDYRALCLFQRVGGVWRWRQYFGAEPR